MTIILGGVVGLDVVFRRKVVVRNPIQFYAVIPPTLLNVEQKLNSTALLSKSRGNLSSFKLSNTARSLGFLDDKHQ